MEVVTVWNPQRWNKYSADMGRSLKALLLCCRWFLLVQRSRTLEITTWSAASKLPWWGWRRCRQTLTKKTEETRLIVLTGRTENKQVDRSMKLLDLFLLSSQFWPYSFCCCYTFIRSPQLLHDELDACHQTLLQRCSQTLSAFQRQGGVPKLTFCPL